MSAADPVQLPGCKHYRRKCRIVSPCCGLVYPCRLCHNEGEAHEIDRKMISYIECLECGPESRQPAAESCIKCGTRFAEYFCGICKLWDDEGNKKNIYHCEGCGICRIGPREKYFHCDTCCACYPVSLRGNHVCINGALQNNCPICLEDMFSSRRPVVVLKCGHNIHAHCQRVMNQMDLLQSIRCPTCSKTIAEDPSEIWKELESHIEKHPMPEELRGVNVTIHCNDCNLKSAEVALNLIAMKCSNCSSYNTNRV